MKKPQEQRTQPSAPLSAPPNVHPSTAAIHKLSIDTIKHLSSALRSSDAEVAQMIKGICAQRHWSRARLAAIMCVDELELKKYEGEHKHPSGTVARLIWFIYHLLYAPEIAMSLPHITTWGHIQPDAHRQPINHELTEERREQIIAELRACAESKYRLPPKKKSLNQLALHYGFHVRTVENMCKRAGYKAMDGRRVTHRRLYGKRRTPPILAPGSIWVHVDWNKSLKTIAAETHVTPRTVDKAFKKLVKVPKTALIRHLKAIGITNINQKFERVFFKMPRRKTMAEKFQLNWDEEENNTNLPCQNNTQNNTVANANDEAGSAETKEDVGPQAHGDNHESEALLQRNQGGLAIPECEEAQGEAHQ